ncbi:SAFB-like transcription modulator [Linepithema humile]|uniref:SAFB-like transcription modulator n=1 Tax=Linepithema humile TaxID=83485 RepID=UPI00351DD2D6
MAEPGSSAINDDLNAKLADMTTVQLKDELKRRKLKTTGLKNELILRLSAIMQIERDHGELEQHGNIKNKNDDEDTYRGQEDTSKSNTTSSDDDEEPIERRRNRTRNLQRNQLLTFRDVEESLETFSGDDKVDVTRWIKDFEEMAALCEWSDIQKMAYGKRLLRGSAKLFVNYEKCTKTWKKLRKALIEEFADVVDSHTVHQELARRKKKSDESYHAYIYKMLQIAVQADVDTRSVIQYIVEGVQDDAVNKTVLHGAKTIRELKEKFTQYEAIRREGKSKIKLPKQEEDKKKKTIQGDASSAEKRRCFNCGSRDHLGKTCPTKDKGAKCFKCNQYGHIAKICKETVSTQKEAAYVIAKTPRQKQLKQVEIANQHFISVIDTGSDLSLINRDCYEKIGCPKLKNKINFDGVGALNNSTYGSFTISVIIDSEIYEIIFHVVDNQIMKHAILIGADFLNQVELHAIKGQVTIRKIVPDMPKVLKIDTVENTDLFDFSHISDKNAQREVEIMTRKYKPKKTREIDIKMTLILKDDIPIY